MSGEMSPTNYGTIHNDSKNDVPFVDQMYAQLKYFFLNPWQKWTMKQRFPWKLLLQIIKVVLVTIQVVTFGYSRADRVDFLGNTNVAFKYMFLQNWSPTFETRSHLTRFAVYTHEEFFESLNYALYTYGRTEDIAMGTFQFSRTNATPEVPHVTMCVFRYESEDNSSYEPNKFDEIKDCFPVVPIPESVLDMKLYTSEMNHTLNFDSVNRVTLDFELTAIHVKYGSKMDYPDCYMFQIQIAYDNSAHSGQMTVRLNSKGLPTQCSSDYNKERSISFDLVFATAFDMVMITISCVSLLLCCRSLYSGHKLKLTATHFFRAYYGKELTKEDLFEFLDLWYVLIIINDFLIILGSVIKISINHKLSHDYESCGLLLGISSLLTWIGVLRYLGLFNKYNILLRTMKRCASTILRYLVCVTVIYIGFTLCGWVVIGPYHPKFRHLYSTSETLMSIVNGDEVFQAFSGVDSDGAVWWFSRIYLYIFICLFSYVVLSVLAALIMDAYDTIQGYKRGYPKNTIEQFIEEHDHIRITEITLHERRRSATGCPLVFGCLSGSHSSDVNVHSEHNATELKRYSCSE